MFALSNCSAPSQVHKELWEIIRPQDEALSVIRRLLDWIGEVDLASQRGAPRPAFKASDGRDIFPPADLLEAVCAAWEKAGVDVVECLRRATQVTNE